MPRSTRRPAATRPRPWRNWSLPWRRSDELPTGLLGRAAPHGETLRSRPPAGPRGPRAPETAAGEPGHPEPRGPRRGAALHPPFTDELRNRHGLLSARIVHDEIQSEVHRRTRGPPDRRADPSGSGRVHGPGCPAPPVRTPGGARDDLKALESAASDKTLAFMLTNPNTLGIFEDHVLEIADIIHAAGGLLYYDGANFNAILGRTSPGKMNFDIVHFNLHKTFTTPHGGGGPGAGPVGVRKALEPFLPVPQVHLNGRGYHLDYDRPKSIGKVRAWYGNFALLVRAYAYILRMGGNGL